MMRNIILKDLAKIFYLILLTFSFSCNKSGEEIKPSAQNYFQSPSANKVRRDWFLSKNEFGAYSFNDIGNSKGELFRVGYDFSKPKFNNHRVAQFSFNSILNLIHYTSDCRIIQLDETRFLQINTIIKGDSNSYIKPYTQVFITDAFLKKTDLVVGRDSSYDVKFARLLPDNRVILVERDFIQSSVTSCDRVSCINGFKIDWIKKSKADAASIGLFVSDQSILLLQTENTSTTKKNAILSYDFSGNLKNSNKLLLYQDGYRFNFITPFQNKINLVGIKFNNITKRNDFLILAIDENLNPLNEIVIPIKNFIDDYDYQNGASFSFPIILRNSIWFYVSYKGTKFGSSLKLVKLNSSLEIENVKPIIENIPSDISNVGLQTDNQYLYLGGLNYRGCFFYRLNQNGDFE